jgi:hypothetical protein
MLKNGREFFLARSAYATLIATICSLPLMMFADQTSSRAQTTVISATNITESDIQDLRTLAQTYLDAAYDMDADKFASLFHPSSSVTRLAPDDTLSVTPIAIWLEAVRKLTAPKEKGEEREDQILSIEIEDGRLATVKLKLVVAPNRFTDVLSCVRVNGKWQIGQKVTMPRV